MNKIKKMQGSALAVYDVDKQKDLIVDLNYLVTTISTLGNNIIINNATNKKIAITNLFLNIIQHDSTSDLSILVKSNTIDFILLYLPKHGGSEQFSFSPELAIKTLNGEDLIIILSDDLPLNVSVQYYYVD